MERGEVGAVLGSHPDIGEAAVVLEHHPHDRLVAYLVPADASRPPALGELRELAARRLPAWAQPSQMVVLAALPRTRHGKVDRGGLPAALPQRPAYLTSAAPAARLEGRRPVADGAGRPGTGGGGVGRTRGGPGGGPGGGRDAAGGPGGADPSPPPAGGWGGAGNTPPRDPAPAFRRRPPRGEPR